MTPSQLRELKQIYPPDRLLDSEGARVPFQSDGLTAFIEKPQAIVLAESEQDVVRTLRWCSQHRIPFVARGSGTSLSGGSLPCADGIVIALNRMQRILDLDPVARVATVQPGTINLAVTQAALPHGLYYAPDPSSQQVCTIGGNVAFNSGGAHCLKYGMTSNHILGLRVVLPDGEIVELGGASLEAAGPDAVGLFVGSEGLFGVATEIQLRLLPVPESVHTITAGYASVEQAGHAVSKIIESGLLPAAMEIMDYWAIQAAMTAVPGQLPRGCARDLDRRTGWLRSRYRDGESPAGSDYGSYGTDRNPGGAICCRASGNLERPQECVFSGGSR